MTYTVDQKQAKLRGMPDVYHSSTPIYDIEPGEWKGITEVKDGEFNLFEQWYDDENNMWVDLFPVERKYLWAKAKTRQLARPKPAEEVKNNELTIEDYKEVFEDHKRLVRELDVMLNGKDAAEQASLCDIVSQIRTDATRFQESNTVIAIQQQEIERLKGLLESNYKGWFRVFYRSTSTMTARQISEYESEQWEQFKSENNL